MIKVVLSFFVIGAVTLASAHHMAKSDVAGVNIVEWSPHLDMEF